NRPRVLEINPRLAGGMTTRIHRELRGVDHAARLLDVLRTGRVRQLSRPVAAHVCGDVPLAISCKGQCRYLGYEVPQILPWGDHLDYCCVEIHPALRPGAVVTPSQRESYFAFAYITAPDHPTFLALAKQVREKVQPRVGAV